MSKNLNDYISDVCDYLVANFAKELGEIQKGWYWRDHSKITEIKCSDGVVKLKLKSKK